MKIAGRSIRRSLKSQLFNENECNAMSYTSGNNWPFAPKGVPVLEASATFLAVPLQLFPPNAAN